MPPMPGDGDTVEGGIQDMDDGRGPFVIGEAEGTGPVQGVWVGDGAWVGDRAHADAEFEVSGGETELGSHGSWKGTTEISDGLPDHRGTTELPG